MFRKLLGRCFDFLLGLASSVPPRAAIGLVQGELTGLYSIGPDQGELGRRNKRSIIASEFEPDHLTLCTVPHVDGLQTIKQTQATLEMNDGRAALGNIRVIEGGCPGFGHRLRMMGAGPPKHAHKYLTEPSTGTVTTLRIAGAGAEHRDLGLDARRAPIRSKGGDTEWICWGSGTAHLLPRLIRGRQAGPVFLSERRPGPACRPAARDLCPATGRARLGYDRARILFTRYTGWELHQLRHSAATHLGEQGIPLQLIMAKTRHRNPRTAMRYVRPGAEAVAEITALLEPPRRRG